MSETTVLIVGAGPTGLTLACDLARRGVAFRIVDAAPAPCIGSRGKGLQPRTLEVFDDLGVASEVLAAGGRYPRFRPHFGRLALGSWALHARHAPTPDVPYPETWLVPQARTEAVLRARLERGNHRVDFATRCTGFAHDGAGVTATLEHAGVTRAVRARYLVGADGGRSYVRRALGVAFEGEAFEGERMVVGDVRVDGLDRAYWHVWPLTRGAASFVALCPLPDGETFQLTAKLRAGADAPALDADAVRDFVAHATRAPRGVRVRDAPWLSLYRPHVRLAASYRVGPVFLAGDAAHVHPPDGGQGLNTGVQDAYNLGWKLGRVLAGAPDALLDSYEAERRPIAARVLGLSARLHRGGVGSTRRGRDTQQLDIGYRDGPLACDLRTKRGALEAGDRAPDAPCLDAHGGSTRLFDAYRGGHFTLLALGACDRAALSALRARHGATVNAYRVVRAGAGAGDDDVRVDYQGCVRRAYDVAGDALLLVRPDGYVGVFAPRDRFDAIEAYLARA